MVVMAMVMVTVVPLVDTLQVLAETGHLGHKQRTTNDCGGQE
jgi:hypothetical protein